MSSPLNSNLRLSARSSLGMSLPDNLHRVGSGMVKSPMAFVRQDSQTGSVASGSSVVEDNLSDLENQSSTDSVPEDNFQSAASLNNLKEDSNTAEATAKVASAVQANRNMSAEAPMSPKTHRVVQMHPVVSGQQVTAVPAQRSPQVVRAQNGMQAVMAVQNPDGTIQHVAAPMYQLIPQHHQLATAAVAQSAVRVAPTQYQATPAADSTIVVDDGKSGTSGRISPRSVSFAPQPIAIPYEKKTAQSTIELPEDEDDYLPRNSKRAYMALVTIGFIAWIVGLVGVSGTTATCPELSNDFDNACRTQLRMAWFGFWWFVFVLMAMCTCLLVGLFEQARTVLMVMWGVAIPILAVAVDNTYSLNDRLEVLNAAAQQSSDFRQYMLQNDAQNFVNCTFAGGILMAVCSTIYVIFAGGLDRFGHLSR